MCAQIKKVCTNDICAQIIGCNGRLWPLHDAATELGRVSGRALAVWPTQSHAVRASVRDRRTLLQARTLPRFVQNVNALRRAARVTHGVSVRPRNEWLMRLLLRYTKVLRRYGNKRSAPTDM